MRTQLTVASVVASASVLVSVAGAQINIKAAGPATEHAAYGRVPRAALRAAEGSPTHLHSQKAGCRNSVES